MRCRRSAWRWAWVVMLVCAGAGEAPGEFPTYRIEGKAELAGAMRELYWLHYPPLTEGRFPTLYDEWLTEAAIWPATKDAEEVRRRVGEHLAGTIIDGDGYVASHMHHSVAHPLGWPLPPGYWGSRSAAWHFSFKDQVSNPYRINQLAKADGWEKSGVKDEGVKEDGWHLELGEAGAAVASPGVEISTYQAPYLLIVWRGEGMEGARPYVEWDGGEGFGEGRRVEVETPDPAAGPRVYHEGTRVCYGTAKAGAMVYTAVPMYRHPEWTGKIRRVRVGFGNAAAGGKVTLQALVTSFDTRHNINNPSYIHACADYFRWTGDVGFLRGVIGKMRAALRHMEREFSTRQERCVVTRWVGHEGRSGRAMQGDGKSRPVHGEGIGSNYWDLLPFGHKDAYATIRYYDAVRQMAEVERAVGAHPEWGVDAEGAFDPAEMERHAAEVKEEGNRIFWNAKTGRFVACVDSEGVAHDYGYTFVNLEAVYYGFATDEHAREIFDWLDGRRVVEGDTSTGADIYRWRFGPRASTRRNVEWYTFWWDRAERVPWGGQVQDGGAVLAFSYHDVMARLRVNGAEDAGRRMEEIAAWFGEVQRAGGYRKYYDGTREGTLQGGGPAGGLGMDQEFKESAMVTLPMLKGFVGFRPTIDGFAIEPRVPAGWGTVEVDRIRFRGYVLKVRVSGEEIEVSGEGEGRFVVEGPGGRREVFEGGTVRMAR